MAFLDILPMAPGHILVTTRDHYQKVSDLYNPKVSADWLSQQVAIKSRQDSRAIGEWLPLVSRALCKVTGIEDWNIVQNNGERAAQVVPVEGQARDGGDHVVGRRAGQLDLATRLDRDRAAHRGRVEAVDEAAHLDEGSMWPTSWALTTLGEADAERVRELVRRAVG